MSYPAAFPFDDPPRGSVAHLRPGAAFAPVAVVGLADEFGVSMADMLAICDRLGCDVDADQSIGADSARQIRELVSMKGPDAVLGRRVRPTHPGTRSSASLPELGSVWNEGVRTRMVLALALIIVSVAGVLGVVANRWFEGRAGEGRPPVPAAGTRSSG